MQERPPRYQIERPVQYRVRTSAIPIEGTGRTLNISRNGLLFEPGQNIGVGAKIDMNVQMGDAVGGGAPIVLRVSGVTLRSQGNAVAVSIKKYKLQAKSGVEARR
ncbi:MAG: hypothetical protein H6509_01900 [Bryobacterales bacterium]|nr:hypothetical protein [Acidobacteriota bacterium]MCB9383341.1 hypothetical protein [Bryobacterales bacterium]